MDDNTPVELEKPYKHKPEDEPRPYYRYDRFMSCMTGYVWYYGRATNTLFRHSDQLMQEYVPTVGSIKAQQERFKEDDAYIARIRAQRKINPRRKPQKLNKKDCNSKEKKVPSVKAKSVPPLESPHPKPRVKTPKRTRTARKAKGQR